MRKVTKASWMEFSSWRRETGLDGMGWGGKEDLPSRRRGARMTSGGEGLGPPSESSAALLRPCRWLSGNMVETVGLLTCGGIDGHVDANERAAGTSVRRTDQGKRRRSLMMMLGLLPMYMIYPSFVRLS